MSSNRHGFSLVIVIIFVAILGVVGFAAISVMSEKSKNSSAQEVSTESEKTNESNLTPDADLLQLKNLGLLRFEDNIITNDALRDYASQGLKGLYVFGDKLSANRLNPSIEYASVKPDAEIVAAVDGIIVFIRSQEETGDYEVFLQTNENSQWMIGYDHLSHITVSQGDKVKAGDVLGRPTIQGNGFYRFEFQVNRRLGNNQDEHICPLALLDSDVAESVESSFVSYLQKWETITGESGLYDEDKFSDNAGCYANNLTPAQAEGR